MAPEVQGLEREAELAAQQAVEPAAEPPRRVVVRYSLSISYQEGDHQSHQERRRLQH